MPRHDARLRLEDRFTAAEVTLLHLLLDLLNEVRRELGMAEVDEAAVLTYLRQQGAAPPEESRD